MTPPYNRWRQRQAYTIELYRLGLHPHVIAWWIGVSPHTVWNYLRGVPRLMRARQVAKVSVLPRAPYWELHTRLGAAEVVAGRKFCSTCGRWRQLCDYPHERRGAVVKPLARCEGCSRATRRYYDSHMTPAQVANRREAQRFYKEGERRAAGVPVAWWRKSVVDRPERVYLPNEPLGSMLDSLTDETLQDIVRRTGIGDRQLRRIITGESRHVRLDLADKLALALGTHLYDLYGDTPTLRAVSHQDDEVPV